MRGIAMSIIAHWQLVLAVVLGTAALGYAAFILRNWKIAVAALFLICWFVDRQHQYANGFNARIEQEVAEQTKTLRARVATLEKTTKQDQAQAAKDAAEISDLRKKAETTPENTKPALPLDAVKRIGAVQ